MLRISQLSGVHCQLPATCHGTSSPSNKANLPLVESLLDVPPIHIGNPFPWVPNPTWHWMVLKDFTCFCKFLILFRGSKIFNNALLFAWKPILMQAQGPRLQVTPWFDEHRSGHNFVSRSGLQGSLTLTQIQNVICDLHSTF